MITVALNIVQPILGLLIGNSEQKLKEYFSKKKIEKNKNREEFFSILKTSFNSDTNNFASELRGIQDYNSLKNHECILLNYFAPLINRSNYNEGSKEKNKKPSFSISSLGTNLNSIANNIVSLNKNNYKSLLEKGGRKSEKWKPMGMQILGDPEIVKTLQPLGEGKNEKLKINPNKLKLDTPITLVCNPNSDNTKFLNNYNIINAIGATSSKKPEHDEYMFYDLSVPLFDIIKEQEYLKIRGNNNNQQDIIKNNYYKVKTNLIKLFEHNKEETKVLEIYSGKSDDGKGEYDGFTGLIRVYFTKNPTKFRDTFIDIIDNHQQALILELEAFTADYN